MPKDSDQPSNGDDDKQTDPKETRAKETSAEEKSEDPEALVQKRMRRNTPSPHRITPQCMCLLTIDLDWDWDWD